MNTPKVDKACSDAADFPTLQMGFIHLKEVARGLERDLKRFTVWNAELLEALEQLHTAIEADDGTLDAAMRRAGRHIDEMKGIVPDVREITLHTDAVNRPVLDMSKVKTQPHEQILFRETSH